MGSIGLIESEPDVSSLVEAKAAWFRSEILRHLARAFSLSGSHAEAVLLLTRAQLYIRQARQAGRRHARAGQRGSGARARDGRRDGRRGTDGDGEVGSDGTAVGDLAA